MILKPEFWDGGECRDGHKERGPKKAFDELAALHDGWRLVSEN